MDAAMMKEKMGEMMKPCACGSGKMAWQCCRASEAQAMANEMCPCGSGKTCKDCCMANPDAHKGV